jgi:hypothetical protein
MEVDHGVAGPSFECHLQIGSGRDGGGG